MDPRTETDGTSSDFFGCGNAFFTLRLPKIWMNSLPEGSNPVFWLLESCWSPPEHLFYSLRLGAVVAEMVSRSGAFLGGRIPTPCVYSVQHLGSLLCFDRLPIG